jgi:hypothetical protein
MKILKGADLCCSYGTLPPSNAFPTSDYSLYVLQPGSTAICPFYVPGEICVSSTYISSGYINRPEETARAFIPHPYPSDAGHTRIYRTGDRDMLLGDHRFVTLGRVDFQFKVDGNRVQLEEVEAIVALLPQVGQNKVVLVEPSFGPPTSTCCVILADSFSNDTTSEKHWSELVSAAAQLCRDRLPDYMVPRQWLHFSRFPQTPTAKVDVKALAFQAREAIGAESKVARFPRMETPHQLSRIGQIFLDTALAVLTDDHPSNVPDHIRNRLLGKPFIASGGSSLLALKLMNLLRREGVELSQKQLYSRDSLMEIAAGLRNDHHSNVSTMPISTKLGPSEVTMSLLTRLPTTLQYDLHDIEAVFPATMLRREMLVLSMLDPKLWIMYQYFDISKTDCTEDQLHEAPLRNSWLRSLTFGPCSRWSTSQRIPLHVNA